jgi:hypothetical protein
MKIGIAIASAVFVFVFMTVAILYAAGLSKKSNRQPLRGLQCTCHSRVVR